MKLKQLKRIRREMKVKQLIYGIATFVPGIKQIRDFLLGKSIRDAYTNTSIMKSARYCYSVWLRHLIMAKRNGLNPYPKIVGELGPGNSLGVGLAALISGCDKYFALDIVKSANDEKNVKIFDELVTLFKNRTPVPGEDEFPKVKPYLEKYEFPADILNENRLQHALEKSRIERIRHSINDFQRKDSLIQYKVPWDEYSILEKESVDMIFSQAVLEHIDDLRSTYRSMYSLLKSTGYISHTIDFKSHGTADEWNGHWLYPSFMWKLIRGKRPYLINREPHSTHIELIENEGFRVVCDKKITSESKFTVNELAPKFRSISQEDLVTSGTFIQAVKKLTNNV